MKMNDLAKFCTISKTNNYNFFLYPNLCLAAFNWHTIVFELPIAAGYQFLTVAMASIKFSTTLAWGGVGNTATA